MEQASDNYLIEQILEGRTECFSALMERYDKPVFSLIVKIVDNRQDAEELTQDVFLKAFRSLFSFRHDSSFSTWLYRIAWNAAVSATRKQQNDWMPLDDDLATDLADEDAENEVESMSGNEQTERLHKALGQLPPDDRALITMFYMQDKTTDEISRISGLSLPNVKTRLHRIRKRLFTLMTKRY